MGKSLFVEIKTAQEKEFCKTKNGSNKQQNEGIKNSRKTKKKLRQQMAKKTRLEVSVVCQRKF